MKKINIGLTGLGRIGKVHLQNLVNRMPEAEVIAVSDINSNAKQIADEYGIPVFYKDFSDLVNHPNLDAVVICSPTTTHLEYIKLAAAMGRHIFCEKPLEMTVEKIKEIDETVNTHQVKLQVGFNRRFDANFAKLKSLVESGQIGEPHILKITSRDPAPPPMEYIKVSGGMFLDMTIHDFDMARFIVGSEVLEVYAQGNVLVDKRIGEAGDIDTAIILLKFESGTLATIDNSRKAVYGYDQRIEIFGSKGMSQISNNYPDTHILYNETGGHSPLPLHFFMERYTEAYFGEMNAFISAIKEDKKVPVDSYDALMATKIAVAARRSMEGNRPVRMEEI